MPNHVEILSPTADTVFLNGTIITVNARDEIAAAIAVRGRRILRVGDRSYIEQTIAQVLAWSISPAAPWCRDSSTIIYT